MHRNSEIENYNFHIATVRSIIYPEDQLDNGFMSPVWEYWTATEPVGTGEKSDHWGMLFKTHVYPHLSISLFPDLSLSLFKFETFQK